MKGICTSLKFFMLFLQFNSNNQFPVQNLIQQLKFRMHIYVSFLVKATICLYLKKRAIFKVILIKLTVF